MKLGSIIADKFRIERVVGRGAMGVVVEATDVALGRRVAVKLILPHYATDPQLRGRFIREARTMTRLQSEHVAKIYEAGELDDGMLFLAMEYLEGQSLEDLVQSGGPLPPADAVDLVLEALDAIAEAHDLGLVHRDLKPSNLFLTARKGRSPIVKVLDFGIVKDSADQRKLTASGTLPGTPAYMAPEQIAVEENLIDARADVWAIGVTLHEILTGRLPFEGPLPAMLTKIRAEAPPRLRATRPDVARELEAIIGRCLAKQPGARFANARELLLALRDVRTRGLIRSERGRERDIAATEINMNRRMGRRQTAATETEPAAMPSSRHSQRARPRSRSGLVTIALAAGAVLVVVGLLLAMTGRLAAQRGPAAPATANAAPLSPTSSVPRPR